MNRLLFLLFLILCPFVFAQPDAVSGSERILSFHSEISVEQNGRVNVTENIKVYVTWASIHRGIFRTLPRWRNLNGKKNKVAYDIKSVQRNDEPEKYRTENTGSDIIIYFGRKDYVLPVGVHEYQLSYSTSDQIGFFKTHDEFYWNVNGTQWDFRTDEVSATVTFPAGANISQHSCYTGGYGGTEQNCTMTETSAHQMAFSAKNLGRNEGLTIALGVEKGLFASPPPPGFWEQYGVLLTLILAAAGLCAYYIIAWQRHGIDPEKPVIFPQFHAPQDLSPASLGYLEKGFYTPPLISAALVSLAVKGYVKIVEKDERILAIFGGITYEVIKLKDGDDALPVEEQHLLEKLFPDDKNTVHFNGKYSSRIENAVTDFQANLRFQHDKFLKKGNNTRKLILPLLTLLLLTAGGLYLSYEKTYSEFHLIAGILLTAALTALGIVFSIYFERNRIVKFVFALVAAAAVFLLITVLSADESRHENSGFYAVYGFVVFGFISLVLFQYFIKQPTPEKLETLSLIEGFRMYLGTAEEKQLQFHNPPKMTPETFETLLPYAMVLGVEKIWGDKFQKMLQQSGITEPYQTGGWFVGHSLMSMNFAHTLNSSLSQSIASSATQPSSSGSGLGGGGFSGGGGGGGGGGGW